MSAFPRYAIYHVPPQNDRLYRFGAELLGYDAYTGGVLAQPQATLDAFSGWPSLTEEPRTYGFHATLKPPFSLSETNEAKLLAAFDGFAASPRTIPTFAPTIKTLGHFVALVPDAANDVLAALVNDCVIFFDSFRAPPTEADRARRLKSPLSERQIALLDRWGYPYVFEEFRFHMTLTGSLPADLRRDAQAHLHEQFSKLKLSQVAIDRIGLFRQDEKGGRFRIIHTAPLVPAA